MMWPPMLDMTRDECRGVLRRLELETYSNVVSTFRAQGGLSDTKIKLLEDLRNAFHISTDRHRAEARRAANDEQLCTIAEAISGPNTTQEWSREGRRSFPLLPRASPFTALSAVANGVADIAKNRNAKLPYPSETTRVTQPKDTETVQDVKLIVKQDPTVVSAEEKRILKRQAQQIPESVRPSSPTCKKRTLSGDSPSSDNAQQSPQDSLHTNAKIQQLYHSHSKTQSRHKKGSVAKRGASGSAKGTPKGYVTPTPSPAKMPVTPKTPKAADSFTTPVKNNLPMPRNLHSYASSMPQQNVQYDNFPGNEKSGKLIVEPAETSTNGPQIATSKKDITNNLSKLNMMTNTQLLGTPSNSIIAESARMETSLLPAIFTVDGRPMSTSVASPSQTTWVQKSLPTATATTIAQRPAKILSANTSAFRPNSNNNKQLPQSPHQASPNSSAISLSSGYININQKSMKPENATIVNLKDGKEIELANTGMVASTAFVRQDSIVSIDSASCKPPTIIGTGNFDLKTNTEVNPALFSGSSTPGTRPKIQIHSNQTISPAFGNIKLATGMQLKSVTGRKAVQIVSSGKVFIQSADGSKSQSGSMPTSGTLTTNANRYAFQKVQILPSSSTTPIKPININKSEVILMPSGVLTTTSNSGNVVVRSLPLMKQNNRLSTQIISKPLLSELNNSGAGLAKNQNVIVIGAVPTEKTVKVANNKTMHEGNMITEDTPVDILTTPISNMENQIDVTTPTMSKVIPAKYEIKSPITVVQTIASPNNDETTTKRLLVKEETLTRLAVNHKMQQQQQQQTSKAETLKATRQTSESADNENSYIVSSTDWEVELDHQQATASKNRSNQTIIIQEPPQQIQSADVSSAALTVDEDECKDDTSQQIIDNFNDVIEEDTTYEEESIINETTEGEDDVDYDISYASAHDDIEDHVAIEYVEDGGTSSDAMIEEYGEIIRSDTDDNDRSHSKMMPVSHAQTIIYSTSASDHKNKVLHSSDSSSVIYEIDENGFNQINR